jgi:release factor glutamine methyltransferase
MHLREGGWLMLEHGYDQTMQVKALLNESFDEVASRRDLAGIVRVTSGRGTV